MYVFTIHAVSDPEAFWGGKLNLPEGTELPVVMPSADGSRGVCIFKSDSVDTVRRVVDEATSEVSRNEFFAINEATLTALDAPDQVRHAAFLMVARRHVRMVTLAAEETFSQAEMPGAAKAPAPFAVRVPGPRCALGPDDLPAEVSTVVVGGGADPVPWRGDGRRPPVHG